MSLRKLTPSHHLHCYGGHHPLTWIVPEPPASPAPSSSCSSLSDSAVNVCVPPKFWHWSQSPSGIASGGVAFGKWLGLDEVTRAETQVGIRVYKMRKELWGIFSVHVRTQWEGWLWPTRKRVLNKSILPEPDLGLELWENQFLLCKTPSLLYFIMAAWADPLKT